MDPAEFLARQLVIRRAAFLEQGFTERQYKELSREHLRVRRGILVHRDAPPDLRLAATLGGALTCASAATFYRLWVRDPPEQAHIAFTRGQRVPRTVNAHRRYSDQAISRTAVLPLAEVCAHALTCLGPAGAISLVESAIILHRLDAGEIRRFLGNRHGRALALLGQVRGGAGSLLEVEMRLMLDELGVRYTAQCRLPGIGRVDFLVEGFLIIETDGWAFHGSRDQWRTDMDRTTRGIVDGYVTLRFRAEQLWHRSEEVRATILAVLGRLR
ncbi:hypothetical protein GCM10027591_08690 [Zhihengliuella somnathii]